MRMLATTLALAAAGALASCAGAVPGNLQGCSGITHVDARWGAEGRLERVEVCQGKAGESFDVEADLSAGTVAWRGKGVLAFDGQAVRAEVEKAVSGDAREAMPTIVDAVMEALKRSIGAP